MDRTIVYPSEQPTDTLWLNAERNKMIALGWLAQGVLGTGTVVDGLACTPTTPASLAVQIGPGAIYAQVPVDSVSYGSLGIDTVDQIVKQGVSLPVTALTLTPPSTAGQAINYLIEAELVEQDTGNIVLSYFNSANPAMAFTGPGGSGTAQPTLRQCGINFVAKAGVAATAGSQVTPAPDAGYVGLWVVTVANGASALTSAQIGSFAGAPFIAVKLPQMPAWVQGGTYGFAIDTGAQNAMVVALNPAPATIGAGFEMRVRKIGTASNGPMTIAVNGAPQVALVAADGSAMSTTQVMPANYLAHIAFDGTSWRFMNGITASAVGSLSASSGEGINVNGSGVVALNLPSLSVEPTVGSTDLWPFYSQNDGHHRVLSWLQLISALRGSWPGTLQNVAAFAASSTWNAGASSKSFIAIGFGGGGAGGSCQNGVTVPSGVTSLAGTSGGGGAGGGFLVFGSAVSYPSLSITIGSGGAPVSNSVGGSGGLTKLGALASATGGAGGWPAQYQSNGQFTLGSAGGGGSGSLGAGVAGLAWNGQPGVAGGPGDGGPGGGTMFGTGGSSGDDMHGVYGKTGGNGSNGGGGGGSDQGGPGGSGGNGLVVIFEFA
ncbi:hypothetical protein [Methylovirgula sp. 4M-Z18]|uniref:hypothetical protein n=1 Tax=Methylovirgula sp. 4M-Z18 TaxID=2293567 RepID=UPI000E2F0416|nr:hypothetical protein [Methylovirgula sp. 4M-Z18]RFB80032.1 hypothetical protein DYH55_00315 [Methylovirgula sp. 4M-Z18]